MSKPSKKSESLLSLWAIPVVGLVVVLCSIVWVFVISQEDRYPPANPVSVAAANVPLPLILVPPFEGQGQTADLVHLANQVHAGVLVHLSQLPDMQVAEDTPQPDDAEVCFEVSGQVRIHDERVIVTVQLNDVPRGRVIWQESFEKAPAEMFELRSAIAGGVVRELRSRIQPVTAPSSPPGGSS